jgi:hypothetical protein
MTEPPKQPEKVNKSSKYLQIFDAKRYLEERKFCKENERILIREQWKEIEAGKDLQVPPTRLTVRKTLTKH